MGAPITWQNVNAPSLADASRPISDAAAIFNNSFAQLGGLIQKNQQVQSDNWQTEKTNNTNDTMNALMSQYKTAADWDNGMKTGAIQALLSAHGHQVDQSALNTFADQRQNVLQGRDVTAANYKNTMTDFEQQGLKDQIGALFASNDPAKMAQGQALLDAHNELRGRAALQNTGTLANHQNVVWNQDAKKFELDQKTGEQALITSLMNARANQESAHAATLNAQTGQGQLNLGQQSFALQKEEKLRADEGAQAQQFGNYMSMNAGSQEGQAALVKIITEGVKDPGDAQSRILAIQTVLKDHPNMSVGVAQKLALGMSPTHTLLPNVIQRLGLYSDAKALDDPNSALYKENEGYIQAAEAGKSRTMGNLLKIRNTIAAGQANNFGMPPPPGGAGVPTTGVAIPPILGGYNGSAKTNLAPSATITAPGSLPAAVAAETQMDRDPAVQHMEAVAAAARQGGSYGPNGWVPNGKPTPAAPVVAAPAVNAATGVTPSAYFDKVSTKDKATAEKAAADTQAKVAQIKQQLKSLQVLKDSGTPDAAPLMRMLQSQLAGLTAK